jgi:2-deoxy-D-gluconate 3-dehydrogenase
MAQHLFDLDGKVALVTGGNRGLGFAIAAGLAAAGAAVAIAARDQEKTRTACAELTATGRNATCHSLDLIDPEVCASVVEKVIATHGKIDILVNNAGVNVRKRPEDYSDAEWSRVIDTNLSGAFRLCQHVHPVMKASGGGKIINLGSMLSLFGGAQFVPYAASKGAIVQMTRSLAVAWAVDNIQVNAILPGWFDTDLTRKTRREVPGLNEKVLTRTPAARWGNPSDLAGAAVFLASAASDFITGASLPVDGGYAVAV